MCPTLTIRQRSNGEILWSGASGPPRGASAFGSRQFRVVRGCGRCLVLVDYSLRGGFADAWISGYCRSRAFKNDLSVRAREPRSDVLECRTRVLLDDQHRRAPALISSIVLKIV